MHLYMFIFFIRAPSLHLVLFLSTPTSSHFSQYSLSSSFVCSLSVFSVLFSHKSKCTKLMLFSLVKKRLLVWFNRMAKIYSISFYNNILVAWFRSHLYYLPWILLLLLPIIIIKWTMTILWDFPISIIIEQSAILMS